MKYLVPKTIRKPFVTGEVVEVCDRHLNEMGHVKIKRAGPKVVALEDGRRFRSSDGWWIGETRAWPFPSIRHMTNRPRPKNIVNEDES